MIEVIAGLRKKAFPVRTDEDFKGQLEVVVRLSDVESALQKAEKKRRGWVRND